MKTTSGSLGPVAGFPGSPVADQQLELGEKQIALAEKKVDAVTQQMDVVTGITDPLEKATHYKKVFGECCDVPQSCCGGGCGCTCADHEEPPTP